ncbi:hypothetical protein MHH28_13570 [Paenibacillus sp. FSL K6-1217]|uniref:hypothetical protein n=1 Tax=Paenibacillus sp. FSL K6-1217 TaxID=2921466 RepID=UPI003246FDDC
MKKFFCLVFAFILLIIVTIGCNPSSKQATSSDWSYLFVVWNGDMYTFNDETVDAVDEQLGEVEEYSDDEAKSFSSNIFSNKYSVGTKIFKIKDVSTDEAIAIESNGKYYKGKNIGKYGS